MPDTKPIHTAADYDAALSEVERLWGAKLGTPEGDRLDMLATLIDSYERVHYPMKVGTEMMRQYRNTLRKLSE